MIEIFQKVKQMYIKYGDKYFIDKCTLANGVYIRINSDLSMTDGDILYVQTKKREDYPEALYDWFREKDFYSKIIYGDTNKCIDAKEKKIFSINPFTLILKRKNMPDMIDNLSKSNLRKININGMSSEQIFSIVVTKHFDCMMKLYEPVYGDFNYEFYKRAFINKSKDIFETITSMKLKDETRIKMFFNEGTAEYKKFYIEYMKDKAFCDKRYSIKISGKTFGAPGYNVTLNPRKPNMLLSSTTFKVPYLVNEEDAMLLYKMSLIIKYVIGELNSNTVFEVDETGQILDYKIIYPEEKTKPYLEYKILSCKDPFDIEEKQDTTLKTRIEVMKELNSGFFKGLLYEVCKINTSADISDFYRAAKPKFADCEIISEMLNNRHILKSYCFENYDVDLSGCIKRLLNLSFIYQFVNSSFKNENIGLALKTLRELWDKEISLLHYFSGGKKYKNMNNVIKKLYENIISSLNTCDDVFEIDNDEMFYFLAGQVSAYIMAQTEARNKTGRIYIPFLEAKNSERIKKEIMWQYEIYSYKMPAYSRASINKALQAVLSYSPLSEFKNDNDIRNIYQAGIIGPNIFYKKMKSEAEQ